jgi:hypothetical protein
MKASTWKAKEAMRMMRWAQRVMTAEQAQHEPVEGVDYRTSIEGRKRPIKPKKVRQ